MLRRIKNFCLVIINQNKVHKIIYKKQYNLNRNAANLIRNVHSIEKGLSLENPRVGFGEKKINNMLTQIEFIKNSDALYHKEAVNMALSVLSKYLEVMKKKQFNDEIMYKIEQCLSDNKYFFKENGGVINISKNDLSFDIPSIEKFINIRHSVRDFSDVKIDKRKLLKALCLAQRCPSACNRQAYRVYVIDDEQKKADLCGWFEGVGGFQDKVQSFVLITGKISSYNESEINQYIVSASIYAAYLSLTLHLYGFGACMIQRPVVWSKDWDKIRQKFSIPYDEQIILAIAVGNLKENFNVPVSYRLKSDEIIKFL